MKIGLLIIKAAFVLWLLETAVFLCLYGWHWRATTRREEICDQIAVATFLIGMIVYFIGLLQWIKKKTDEIDEPK